MSSSLLSRAMTVIRAEAINLFRPEVWVLDGNEASTAARLNLLYVGTEPHRKYIADLAYGENYGETFIGRIGGVSLRRMVKRDHFACPLIVIEGHFVHRWIYQEQGDFFIPLWLEGTVDIPFVPSRKTARADLGRIKRNKLEYVVTTELDRFRTFYYGMHVPYVSSRFQDRAITGDYAMGFDDILRLARYGACELLLVKQGSEFVAGTFIVFVDRLPRLWAPFMGGKLPRLYCGGLKDGDLSYLAIGASLATDYFPSLYLADCGYQSMHMGLSRAFLNDGVLHYKKKWDMRGVGGTPGGLLIKPLRLSQGVRGFLVNNPFVYVNKGDLCGAGFVEDTTPDLDQIAEQLYDEHCLPGLTNVATYELNDSGMRIRKTWPLGSQQDRNVSHAA